MSNPADPLNEALTNFAVCIGNGLENLCTYGVTIGETYVPFDPDPEDNPDDNDDCNYGCSQAWVRVMSISPQQSNPENMEGETCDYTLVAELEVGVIRCLEVLEEGQAPTASDMMAASMQSMEDMAAIHRAAMGCEVWDAITTGAWSPEGPIGGQYGGKWTFTVELPGACLTTDESA